MTYELHNSVSVSAIKQRHGKQKNCAEMIDSSLVIPWRQALALVVLATIVN